MHCSRFLSKTGRLTRLLSKYLKSNKKWGARDRAFIAENTYEIVRWWRLVKYAAEIRKASEEADFWNDSGTWQLIKPTHLHLESDHILPEWPEFEEYQCRNSA
jgi:16S rRNA (cytosine967-C5)-methyltransferase